QPLTPLMLPAFGLDVGRGGVVYFDQFQRSLEVLRFDEDGRGLRRIAPSAHGRGMQPVELPDGRVLLPGLVSGRSRLLAGKGGEDPVGLLHTDEEASPPAVLFDDGHLALVSGSGNDRRLSIAALEGGRWRVIDTVKEVPGEGLMGLAASSD